ncbi:HIT family protein [Lactobacillus taiwanensis]|uniref:HIT family protein n=1 Tax=Lactobacillus taiwanensis TaxID=508451 RepID=UPI002431B42A|nr:HIT family protein [Lactobacillus taiwanensis]
MCLICDRIEMIKKHQNKFFVKELRTGYVVLGDNQHFKGYTLFLYKSHVGELYKLDGNEKIEFLEEMSLVGEAVSKTVRCEKMNYELLGNGDSHLHWHLFPRVSGDLENYGYHGKGPVWWYPREKMYSVNNELENAELEELKQKLRLELDKIFL